MASRPLWHLAQPPLTNGWPIFDAPLPIPAEPKSLALPNDGAADGPVTATPPAFNLGFCSVLGGPVGGLDPVAGLARIVVPLTAGFGAPTELGFPDVVGRFTATAGGFGCGDGPIAFRIITVTAFTAFFTADLTDAATDGAGCFAVVVHVPGD
jgi:hypothetical protein